MWNALKLFLGYKAKKTELLPDPVKAFWAKPIEDIMIPRSDIIAVSTSASFEEVLKKFLKTGLRWMPIYQNTLDTLKGVLSIHSVLSLRESSLRETTTGEIHWGRHLNQAFFAPTSMTVLEALRNLQHRHKAALIFVVDEHGGIEGLLSKGHILKALCSSCFEHVIEEEGEMIVEREPVWVIDGRMDLEAFEEELKAKHLFEEEGESRVNTVGGWLCSYVGRVPLKGEIIQHPSGFVFEIRQATPRKIHQIAILEVPTP
jgi:CBS domain containing-hemolysin-like protein